MTEPARADIRYTAFLSYSHKDAAAAGRLHRRLEAYRIPHRLVGTETPRGPVPQRLWPIFRDREELPAASDLSETVRTALAQSGALIILCSSNAAGSLWVAEEIDTFRKLHPDRPILAAILDGDPPDCFPAALRAFGQDGTWHEPLATDLRPKADGKHLGLLKLVAGITGLGLDDLVQRDAARRIRRVMAVTGAAVVAMLIMTALAVVALNARREAERQRVEAEGMAEFMMSDLHDRLEGVGRLDIMRSVNERALAHYDRQIERGDSSANTQLQRARVLQALGEQDLLQGDLRAALQHFSEAQAITSTQLNRIPDDWQSLYAESQSEYWLGRLAETAGNWRSAYRHYVNYERMAQDLIARAPDNVDYMMAVGGSALSLGNVALNGSANFSNAQSHYAKAVLWFGRAVHARPDNDATLRAQANAYAWLADTYFRQRMWPEALATRRLQYPIALRLFQRDPTNVEDAYRLALAQRAMARVIRHSEQANLSPQLMLAAYAGALRLADLDPRNAEWILFRAAVRCELYFGDYGFPRGVTRPQLAGDIRGDAAELVGRHDPRVHQFDNCVNALQNH